VSALAEMHIQGGSTRKVKTITEELCGHAFSAAAISAVYKTLDESLERFARRPLEEEKKLLAFPILCPYFLPAASAAASFSWRYGTRAAFGGCSSSLRQ
jgi:hypothetical protein